MSDLFPPFAVAVTLLAAGCSSSVSNTPGRAPTGAKNIVEVGNGWVTFDLAIDGQTHTFLYRSYNPWANNATECITEIARPPTPQQASP